MFKSLKGMPDILPSESGRWQATEARLRSIFSAYGYAEIRTPLLEPTELFTRSIGTTTDVVEKEMYSFTDKDGSSVTLRPEGTASAIRSYLEHSLGHGSEILKLYYLGPMFRHERPQKGRLRQFSQAGVEAVGSGSPSLDADVLILAMELLRSFGVPNARMELNSVGDAACRPAYRERLGKYLTGIADRLCENCRRRIDTNPLRVLDCKVETCATATKDAPYMADHLCSACREHFQGVQLRLESAGIPFHVNPRIVRGLDYYTRTAFEVVAGNLGSQNAVVAGGRYDGLAEELGGPPVPSVGWAMGLERLLLSGESLLETVPPRADVIPLGAALEAAALKLATDIRRRLIESGVSAAVDCWPAAQSLKSALRRADKSGVKLAILLGEDERKKGAVVVKDLSAHAQEEVDFKSLPDYILKGLR